MEMTFKNLIFPICVGVFMFVFGAWFNSANQDVVEARLETIDFLTDPIPLLRKEVRDLIRQFEETAKVDGILRAIDDAKVRLSFHELTLSNNSQQRSKEILVSTYRPWFAWMYRSGPGPITIVRLSPSENSDFTLPSINPGDTIKIYLITDSASFRPAEIRVLHDGRKLELTSLTINPRDDALGMLERGIRHPDLFGYLVMMGIISLVWIVIGSAFQIAAYASPDFRARMTAKATIADWVKFLAFLKANYPTKLPTPDSTKRPRSKRKA